MKEKASSRECDESGRRGWYEGEGMRAKGRERERGGGRER